MSESLKIKHALALFSRFDERESRVCFLTRGSKDGWQTILAWNPAAKFVYSRGSKTQNGAKRFLAFVKDQTSLGRMLIGAIAYDFGYELFSLRKCPRNDLDFPDIIFYSFDNYLKGDKNALAVVAKDAVFAKDVRAILARTPPKRNAKSDLEFAGSTSFTKAWYKNAYKKIQEYIRAGDVYQVNLTHRLESRFEDTARALFLKLLNTHKMPFQGYVEGNGFEILASSPERFLRARRGIIATYPIKGTRPRGRTRSEDQRLKRELFESGKERAELSMITDLLRNDVGRVSEFGTVKIVEPRSIAAHPFVWHTYAHIRARLRSGIYPALALVSMFPGGSVTGCPKKRAMEIISELEPRARSFYTGVIGCIEPSGDLDSAIAIRTLIKKDDAIYLNVGGGIVYDSNVVCERKETFDKARPFVI